MLFVAGLAAAFPPAARALDPAKLLSQYSRKSWSQEQGLPQDTIRAIVQTTDGYLWLGTDEGLARFDGYDFTVFNKSSGGLPGNSITALAAGRDGALWIATAEGLARFQGGQFRAYTGADGLPDHSVTSIVEDHSGDLWIVAGVNLSRLHDSRFTTLVPGKDIPGMTTVRLVTEDRNHTLWVAGFGGVAKRENGAFVPVLNAAALGGDLLARILVDSRGNLWAAGNAGILVRTPAGVIRRYGKSDGLPDPYVRALWEDRDGSVWAGTNGGLSRRESHRFAAAPNGGQQESGWVRCIYEDREGNLWVGTNSGLVRLRDDVFTMYAREEGLPGDEPNAVYQDRRGRVWVGFHNSGLMLFGKSGYQVYARHNGLATNEVFSIRESRAGDLLLATRDGFGRFRDGLFHMMIPPDPLRRVGVFDAMEDSKGRLWLATPQGLQELRRGSFRSVAPGGPVLSDAAVVLCEGLDGAIWAGTYGNGLWRYKDGELKLFTTADGLSSDQIRALEQDADGTLWIGTFGGGLNAYRDGRFQRYTAKDGLISDNVSHVEVDDAGSLWLSTTRGICVVAKRQLAEFSRGQTKALKPVNYGVEDGLRSAQCAPGYPAAGGAARTTDGRLWFPTTRGLAVLRPNARSRKELPPLVHVTELTADGSTVDLSRPAQLRPGTGRIQIRYTGIHLSSPERVRYSYKLDGLDSDWVDAGARRVIDYNSLPHGRYRFSVRAQAPDAGSSEISYSFEELPHVYQTAWFEVMCMVLLTAAGWCAYQMRLRQVRGRFALVLDERARLAREIHDTLAQGFVGISSQLDAVSMSMADGAGAARQYLDLARRMARHSITEARRSVMDLRASALEGQDLATALESGARTWTAGSGLEVEVETGGPRSRLPEEVEQNLLRIAQEAVANAVKHAGASRLSVRLTREAQRVRLCVADDGRGFDQTGAFSASDGHFGLIGMRERAERLGGELRVESHPDAGTQVDVTVTLR